MRGARIIDAEMQRRCVLGQKSKPDIVGCRDGSTERVLEDVADLKILKEAAGSAGPFMPVFHGAHPL